MPDATFDVRAARDDLGWHLTATWADVRAKARRIRAEGGVRILVAQPSRVVAYVRGDTNVYETELTRVPGHRNSVGMWSCACAWASYAWGRTGPWRRYEGRQCSHSLATQYEAQSRGMFGREVRVDQAAPSWLDPTVPVRQPGSYDRDKGRHTMLRHPLHHAAPTGAAFRGRVRGVVVDLDLAPDGTVVGPSGPVGEQVLYPSYSPTLGLTVAHTATTGGSTTGGSDGPPGQPTHAGLALKAADTGRVLMLQRSVQDQNDPAAGLWEFPGGELESGDHNTLLGAAREFAEEVGQPVPAGGVVAHTWTSPDGVYQGHVLVIPAESMVTLHEGRNYDNPDDPDGDDCEQTAWWDPDHAAKNPALRPEVKDSPWKEIKMASSLPDRTATAEEFLFLADAAGVADQALALAVADGAGVAQVATELLSRGYGAGRVGEDTVRWYAPTQAGQDAAWAGVTPEEFGDLAGGPQAVDDAVDSVPGVDDDPEHALPVTYGEDDPAPARLAASRTPADPHGWLLAGRGDPDVAAAARTHLAKTSLRDFTPAEQREIIGEGSGGAGNGDRLDLTGTHYELVGPGADDDQWMWG